MTDHPVRVTLDGPQLTATIGRPHRANRLDRSTLQGLVAAVDRAGSDDTVRALVLTGEGERDFCGGGQIAGLADDDVEEQQAFGRDLATLYERLAGSSVPVVAAVNGRCAAAGMGLLHACDLAIAVEHATFGYPEIEAGLFPMLAMAATIDSLPRKVAFELFYTGRSLDAEAALDLHLVNEVVPADQLHDAVARRVDDLSSRRADAIRIGRRAYHAMTSMAPSQSLRHAQEELVELLASGVPRDSDWA